MAEGHTITEASLAPYLAPFADGTLVSRIKALYDQQKTVWADFRQGHEAMTKAQRKTIHLKTCQVYCQCTPHRMRSVSAKVDRTSIRKRPCFLCPDSLQNEEKGLIYGKDYLILCNIAPIFDLHLVISHQQHIPQAIATGFADAMGLARDLSPHFAVVYNGPRCGASAPDHLHFQAFPVHNIPLQAELWDNRHTTAHIPILSGPDIRIHAPVGFSRRFLTLESTDPVTLSLWFFRALRALKIVQNDGADEPMINFVMGFRKDQWQLVLFPREKHRPNCFYRSGEGQLLISPGAIDMAGFWVIPRKRDYERVDARVLEGIYQEVTIQEDDFSRLLDALSNENRSIGQLVE
jgi:ATP adenylyltransferase/5',5'''-P-1,P-4-tetraphosphate phosphorylase II